MEAGKGEAKKAPDCTYIHTDTHKHRDECFLTEKKNHRVTQIAIVSFPGLLIHRSPGSEIEFGG